SSIKITDRLQLTVEFVVGEMLCPVVQVQVLLQCCIAIANQAFRRTELRHQPLNPNAMVAPKQREASAAQIQRPEGAHDRAEPVAKRDDGDGA
ncbi:unnamed protein product, partial [Urochloa humidicola]